jgi:hypothetical protein
MCVPIAKALVNAHKRGMEVEIILEKYQRTATYSRADFLANSGMSTKIDDAHAIACNKERDYVYSDTPNFLGIWKIEGVIPKALDPNIHPRKFLFLALYLGSRALGPLGSG